MGCRAMGGKKATFGQPCTLQQMRHSVWATVGESEAPAGKSITPCCVSTAEIEYTYFGIYDTKERSVVSFVDTHVPSVPPKILIYCT